MTRTFPIHTRFLAAPFLLIAACAGVTTRPLSPDPEVAARDRGIRYLQEAPFLLVYSDGKGGLASEVVFLPDTTQKMSARPFAYLATNETTMSFTNGVLTSQKTTIDETIVPQAMLTALQTAAGAAIGAAFNAPGARGTADLPAPFLFRIVVEGPNVRLEGGQGVGPDGTTIEPIKVTVSAPAKDK